MGIAVSRPVTVRVFDPAAAPTAVIRGDNDAENNQVIRARVGEAIEVNGGRFRRESRDEGFPARGWRL